jgi:outer membrane protein OmpA-like peptidoglycan-associated protein
MNWRRPLFSLKQRRSRQRSAAALSLASALLLATYGPISVAATPTDGSEQRQKLEERRDVNADAQRNANELRRQMDELQAEAIDRGLLLTLDDAVFTTNDATLSSNGYRRLNALADFLRQHPKRSVAIDSYAGAADYRYDQALSKRRADAVKAYLIRQDIAPSRLTARSSGEPLQDPEDSASGQQTIRRVEVIIEDPLSSVPQSDVTRPRT